MGTPKTVRNIEFCQQISRLKDFSVEKFKQDLDDWGVVNKYAFIVHDKDKKDNGDFKEPHIHNMLHFSNPYPYDALVKHFADRYGSQVTEQCFERCKKWTSAVAYLTHENRLDKHKYERSEVVANYDFNEDADEGARANTDARLQEIQGFIDREEMREYNITDYVSIDEHHKYKRAIDDALEYVYNRKAKEVNRLMDVMYISGVAGCGKTTFAKWFCESKGWSYTVSSSSNDPMQDYKGQDVLILDDFRPSQWKMTDLLKLLDNHTTSTVRSRYHNKYMCYCKMVILTSVVPLEKVWDNLSEIDLKEPREQLYRRVSVSANIDKDFVEVRIGKQIMRMENPSVQYLKDKEREEMRISAMFSTVGFKNDNGFIEDNGQIEMVFADNVDKQSLSLNVEQAKYKADEKARTKKPAKSKTPKKGK